MPKKLTRDEIKEKLAIKSPPISIINISQDLTRIDCKCLKCGYEWNASYDKLRRGKGCHKCGGTLKLTLQVVIDRVAKISPNIKIKSTTYLNNKTKLDCECLDCGNSWQSTAHNLLGGYNCKKCGIFKSANAKRYTKDKIAQALIINNPNIEILSNDYHKNTDIVEWKCKKCGTISKTRYCILQQGNKKCEVCRGYKNKKPYSHNEAVELLSNVNHRINIVGQYNGAQNRIDCQCNKCGYIWQPKFNDLQQGSGCPRCAKHESQLERDFLSNFQGWQKDRTILNGKELDAYFADKKIAIEINGAFWHSEEQGKDRDYHLQKTKECEANGIKLFHFFDSELVDKADICKSMIDNALGNTAQIYARNCEVSEISAKEAREFCIENHIQGACIDKVRFGLFYDGELVSVMTFGKSRYDKKFEWELLRFCSKAGYSVVGGASKLLKAFELSYNPKNLISYGNRRWCNTKNNVYATLGFECKGETLPNYFYEKAGKCYNRQTFQRHKLNKAFDYEFSPILTEKEIMGIYGFARVYDCGNLIYTKDF